MLGHSRRFFWRAQAAQGISPRSDQADRSRGFAEGRLVSGRVDPGAGRGLAPAAYELNWAGKKVLLSGKIPQVITQETGQELIGELMGPGGDVGGYSGSIYELRERKPDLWLPARAVNEQNANLYDRTWQVMIEDNVILINFVKNFLLSPGEKK